MASRLKCWLCNRIHHYAIDHSLTSSPRSHQFTALHPTTPPPPPPRQTWLPSTRWFSENLCEWKILLKQTRFLAVFRACSSELGHDEVSLCLSDAGAQAADDQTVEISSKVEMLIPKWFGLSLPWLRAGCLAISHWMSPFSWDLDEAVETHKVLLLLYYTAKITTTKQCVCMTYTCCSYFDTLHNSNIWPRLSIIKIVYPIISHSRQ